MLKNLETASKTEQTELFNSCDQIICDVDGVIWRRFVGLPGSSECVDSFKKLGKDVKLVTNFSAWNPQTYQALLHKNGIKLDVGTDVISPLFAITDYLKKINFDKELYVIGSTVFKNALRDSGFTVAPNAPENVASLSELLVNIQDDVNIGAVIFEFGININLLQLQKALTYLKREDCLYIAGAGDKVVPMAEQIHLLCNYHYQQLLKDLSGREYVQLAKPSSHFKDFIINKFEIKNPEKVLLIGDSISEDINFGKKCGFKTLLVLSGVTKYEHIHNWQHPKETIPDYYIQDLNTLNKMLENIFNAVL